MNLDAGFDFSVESCPKLKYLLSLLEKGFFISGGASIISYFAHEENTDIVKMSWRVQYIVSTRLSWL